MSQGLSGSGSGVERLPDDYKYEDAKPQAPILANTIFGAEVKLKYPEQKAATRPVQTRRNRERVRMPEVNSREALADWMTSKKNPQFTKVVVNRMWARTFGLGLVEPIDDWKKGTEAVHPELFAQLEKLLVDIGYDLRQFERVLVNTQLFQRRCPGEDPVADQAYTFRGPMLRRMSAEQMWDSLLTLVFDDLDERLRPLDVRAKEVYDQFGSMQKATADELVAMAGQRYNPGQMQREQQAMRQEEARKQLAADGELQKRARPIFNRLAQARRAGDQKLVAELAAELEKIGVPLGQRAARGREGEMLRASDLLQPAAENHLLRQFGQSDRETIDGSSTDATVPQVLTLLNGFLDQRVLEGNSALKRDLATASSGERRVRVAYLTTLNREPTPAELQEWRRAIAIDGESVTRDLVWVLCNSNEFRFVQ